MDAILSSLLDLAGVNAVLVMSSGQVVAQQTKPIYSHDLGERIGHTVARVVDSIELQHTEWESLAARFADGKVLLRKLTVPGQVPSVMVIATDSTLNLSFATVAIRIAANKLKGQLDPNSPQQPSYSPPTSRPPGPSMGAEFHSVRESGSHVEVPSSAPRASSPPPPLPSPVGAIPVQQGEPDPVSAAFLHRCRQELARVVGPMARVYVGDALRRVCLGETFSLASASKLLEDVAVQIEISADRATFLSAMRTRPPGR